MSITPRFLRPKRWRNQDLILYHGTLSLYSASISTKVDIRKGNKGTDFGRGFYTTTRKRQARAWAWQLCLDHNAGLAPGVAPATPEMIVIATVCPGSIVSCSSATIFMLTISGA
jgi:Protein of unknown function (DUF3990)